MPKTGAIARLYDSVIRVGQLVTTSAKSGLQMMGVRTGEAGMAHLQGPYGYGGYGIQPVSKTEQVLHFRGWNYTCINYICGRIAEKSPVAALVADSNEVESYKMSRKAFLLGNQPAPVPRRFASDRWKAKSHGPAHANEEYEFLPDDSPLMRLLRDPNDPDTGVSFWYEAEMFNCLTGEDFIWMVRNDAGQVVELWVIPSNWVRPVCLGKNRLVDYFEVSPRGSTVGVTRFEPEEIIWNKRPSPLSKLYAASQLQSMAGDVDTYEKTQAARNYGIDNGTYTSGVITLAPGMMDPDDSTIQRIESRWMAKYSGVFNFNRPPILGPGMQWVPAPADHELAFIQTSDQLKQYIIAQWGLDQTVLGFGDTASWAAVVANIRKTDRSAINTRKRARAEVLTERLARTFDDRYRIFWPEDDPVDPDSVRTDYATGGQLNAVSANDYRTHVLGLEPWPEEIYDRPLVQAGLVNPSEGGGDSLSQWEGDSIPGLGTGGAATEVEADDAPVSPADVGEDNDDTFFKSVEKIGPPPFPGAVFNRGTHRWEKPGEASKPKREGKPKPTTPAPEMSERAKRAQASATRIDAPIQRYCEEHNESRFAKKIGGRSFKDCEPVDVVVDGGVKHGVELKTMVANKNNKITMKRSAMERKAAWEKANKATFHTVVIDDSAVFNAKGEGKHDESKRRIFYRRGFGSFRVNTMYEVKSIAELKKLMNTKNDALPPAAQRPKGK